MHGSVSIREDRWGTPMIARAREIVPKPEGCSMWNGKPGIGKGTTGQLSWLGIAKFFNTNT